MSLVRIMFKEDRIQTGAYSNICQKIFTLNTDDVRKHADILKNVDTMLKFTMNEIIYPLKAFNGLGKSNYIFQSIDDSRNIINLMVS